MNVTAWIKEHPVEAGIFGVGGLALLYLVFMSGGSSSSSGTDDSADAAYYQAAAQQAEAGDALQAVQIESQASTTQDLINAGASVDENTTWATADTSENATNDQAAIAIAPYQEATAVAADLAGVASQTATTTTQSGSSGFFGIGASSKTTTTTTSTPAAVNASNLLDELVSNGFNAGT